MQPYDLMRFVDLTLDQTHFKVLPGVLLREGGQSGSLLFAPPIVYESLRPSSLYRSRRPATVHTIYAGLYIYGASRSHSVRLALNSPLQWGRQFKFEWPDDLEPSAIQARIMNWRGREAVSGFAPSLLHEIIVPRCYNIFLHESVKYGRSRIQRWYKAQDKGQRRRQVLKGFLLRPLVHTILFHLDLFRQPTVLHFSRIV